MKNNLEIFIRLLEIVQQAFMTVELGHTLEMYKWTKWQVHWVKSTFKKSTVQKGKCLNHTGKSYKIISPSSKKRFTKSKTLLLITYGCAWRGRLLFSNWRQRGTHQFAHSHGCRDWCLPLAGCEECLLQQCHRWQQWGLSFIGGFFRWPLSCPLPPFIIFLLKI